MGLKIADLRFGWQPQGPLLVGYGYAFSREAGLIAAGEKRVTQYASRTREGVLTPSLLATSVKGVFRSAAAWLVEREGQIVQGRAAGWRVYVTCDYGKAIPEAGGWPKAVGTIRRKDALCPVCRTFGGSGCLGDESNNALRQQGIVRFQFDGDADALFGRTRQAGRQAFAWEEADGRQVKVLQGEQLVTAAGAQMTARVQTDDPADYALAVALIGLSADLIDRGFFRFGRFTSRGYGWVRLTAPAGRQMALADLLATGAAEWQAATGSTGLAAALLGREPWAVLREAVEGWWRERAAR